METLQRTANRGSISTGYDIDNSLKFEADNSEKLSRSQTTGTNRKKFTVSFWVKRSELGALQVLASAESSGNDLSFLNFETDNVLRFRDTASASDQCILETNRVFRDTSAWYHIVLRVDTTDGTADDRNRIYVNGVQETSFSARTNFDLNDDTFWGYNGGNLTWGNALGEANYYSGYTAEAVYVDGLSLAPTSFGEFDEDTGIWKPINVSGLTFGNNGYYLDFEDSSNLGNDASGGTDFTQTNITSADQATDTPTNNFATLLVTNTHADFTIANGATSYKNTTDNWRSAAASIAVQSGKWYAEFAPASALTFIGVSDVRNFDFTTNYFGNWDTSIAYYGNAGLLFIDGATATFSGSGYGDGYIVGIAFDKDNGYIYWHRDGVWQNSGDPTSGASGTGGIALTQGNSAYQASDIFYIGVSGAHPSLTGESNFGGFPGFTISSPASDESGYGTFEYAPPSGYYALCTKNLAEFG
jgi:hypothetical protein